MKKRITLNLLLPNGESAEMHVSEKWWKKFLRQLLSQLDNAAASVLHGARDNQDKPIW